MQVTTWATITQFQPEPLADTGVRPAGKTSVTVTGTIPPLNPGPLLKTESEYCSIWPWQKFPEWEVISLRLGGFSVKFKDQLPRVAAGPSSRLARNNFQVPLGMEPLNSDAKVDVPNGAAELKT